MSGRFRDAINQAFVAAGFAANNKDTWQRPAPNFSSVWGILKHMEEEIGGNVRNLNLRVQPLDVAASAGIDKRVMAVEECVTQMQHVGLPEMNVNASRWARHVQFKNQCRFVHRPLPRNLRSTVLKPILPCQE